MLLVEEGYEKNYYERFFLFGRSVFGGFFGLSKFFYSLLGVSFKLVLEISCKFYDEILCIGRMFG